MHIVSGNALASVVNDASVEHQRPSCPTTIDYSNSSKYYKVDEVERPQAIVDACDCPSRALSYLLYVTSYTCYAAFKPTFGMSVPHHGSS